MLQTMIYNYWRFSHIDSKRNKKDYFKVLKDDDAEKNARENVPDYHKRLVCDRTWKKE